MKYFTSFIAGGIFALGLGLSGMMNPLKVKMFLDPTRIWDPALAFVMVGAILVFSVGYRLIIKRAKPICDRDFSLPSKNVIDSKRIVGSALFGIGWGLVGICPGPAIANLATGATSAFLFVAVMLLSMFLVKKLEK